MSKTNIVVVINRQPAEVFARLTDFSTWPQWIGGLGAMELVSEGPLKVGSQIRDLGNHTQMRESSMEITAFEPNQTLGLKSSGPPITFLGTFTLQPVDTGTRLTVQYDIHGSRWARLLYTLIFRLTVKGELRKFKVLVEAG